MAKNVLILSASPRKGGNSDLLCDAFADGARASGNVVEKVRVADCEIGYCRACSACERNGGRCAIADDMGRLLDRIVAADVLVLASPVYFYSIAAQLKTVIDRCVARWTEIRDKEFYYILSAAEDSDTVMDGALACMRGFLGCCDGSVEKGAICAKGVYGKGDAASTEYPAQAYRMGTIV